MGLFKSTIRRIGGPTNPATLRILDAADWFRRLWADRLLEPPVPFLNPERSLLVIWSAKCACTVVYVWYLQSVGQLEAFRRSGLSAHAFRGQRYAKSDLFRRGKARMLDDYRIVHVIRDPCLRAVSAYRHELATGYADKRFSAAGLGPMDHNSGFSFSRYLEYLETVDLSRANVHHKQQFHPVEKVKAADRVINISRQDLFTELNRLESEHGMPRTDFTALDWLHRKEDARRARTVSFARGGVADLPFDAAAARGRAPWPDYEQFLGPSVRRRIERLYATDFEAFGEHL
ncbi:MAG TPA: sulfotransferase family 2 domain-containing protein [Propylenella sp.]